MYSSQGTQTCKAYNLSQIKTNESKHMLAAQ